MKKKECEDKMIEQTLKKRDKPDRLECSQDRFACSIISFAGDAEIAFGLLPDRPEKRERPDRPDSGSGPDPCWV